MFCWKFSEWQSIIPSFGRRHTSTVSSRIFSQGNIRKFNKDALDRIYRKCHFLSYPVNFCREKYRKDGRGRQRMRKCKEWYLVKRQCVRFVSSRWRRICVLVGAKLAVEIIFTSSVLEFGLDIELRNKQMWIVLCAGQSFRILFYTSWRGSSASTLSDRVKKLR